MSNVREVTLEWTGDGVHFRGRGTRPPSPAVDIDGDGESGPSPTQQLLLAAGACSAIDVVMILQKMRVGLEDVQVRVTGTRREEHPRRFVSLHLEFRVAGEGADETKAKRAVELSVEKYCSVIHTLAEDVTVTYDVVVV